MRRILTAFVLIPSVIYTIFFGPELLFQLVVAVLAFLCFHEFAAIAAAQGIPVPLWLGEVLGLVFLLAPITDWRLLLAITMLLMVWSLRTGTLSDSLPLASATLLGILYVYGSWRCAPVLRAASPWWLMFAVSLNWVGDSAALYVGKALGKHKLAPVISPQKTWEGAIGSAIFTTIYGVVLLTWSVQAKVLDAALLSFAACAAGQVGDLAESALKRGAGVKDSGTMLPGHGGWLDRLDSTLFSMPVVAFYLSA
ncbi:MAG TPA: phosphatidate cytidylyltransferase [Bryobacteraceae bacterium]|nr:phosphatidate cytidylyltransferase [Bryobacteraceae bacterium]